MPQPKDNIKDIRRTLRYILMSMIFAICFATALLKNNYVPYEVLGL